MLGAELGPQHEVPGGRRLEGGVDIAPSMLTVARARAGREGVDNVEFVVGDAQSGDLGREAFDAVFSQFGVMFFSIQRRPS